MLNLFLQLNFLQQESFTIFRCSSKPPKRVVGPLETRGKQSGEIQEVLILLFNLWIMSLYFEKRRGVLGNTSLRSRDISMVSPKGFPVSEGQYFPVLPHSSQGTDNPIYKCGFATIHCMAYRAKKLVELNRYWKILLNKKWVLSKLEFSPQLLEIGNEKYLFKCPS